MSLASIVQGAFRSLPGSVKGSITFTRVPVTAVQASAGTRTLGAPLVMTILNAAIFPSPPDNTLANDSNRRKERAEVHIAGADCTLFTPAGNDKATWNGMTWTVLSAGPLNPSGASLLYVKVIMEGTR